MNAHFQKIIDLIVQSAQLSDAEKASLIQSAKDAEKELEITAFKLDRTEKVKRTTAILLEETITELEQKRKAVEAQNRKLEIESSLERVRTVAMSMSHRDDMLLVCRTICTELESLRANGIRNVQTAIIDESKGNYLNFEYYRLYDKSIITEVDYKAHKLQETFANQMLRGAGEFFTTTIEGAELKEWYNYQKTTNQFADSHLETAVSLNYYWYSIGPVALGLSTYAPLDEAEVLIFRRFRNVFDLAYRRFLDIENAAAQAREAQIELALERVRARTMAMQKSDELGEVASLLFAQVTALSIKCYTSGFTVWEKESNELISWMSNADGSVNPPFRMPASDIEWHRQQFQSWENQEEYIIHDFTGKEMQELYRYLRSFPLLDEAFKKSEAAGVQTPARQVHNAFNFSYGNLLFITLQPTPESYNIFKRFAKVFEQTYTRFLDLKKAEAQSREAQIQLGLERVRARAMAMQTSDELNALIGTVFTELTKLDLQLTRCVIMIMDPHTNASRWWMANSEAPETPMDFLVKYHGYPPYLAYLDGWRERTLKWEYIIEGTIKKEWDDFIFSETELSLLPDFVIAGMRAPERVYLNASFNNFGNLTLAALEPLSNEHADILLRFAKVFDLTYTRFNDLKQAEAQAREAQIQLALERVRARTMAMYRSEELGDISHELFKQIQSLGVATWHCAFNIYDEDQNSSTEWGSNAHGTYPIYKTPRTGIFLRYYEIGQTGETLHIEVIGEDRCADHYAYLCTLPGVGEQLIKLRNSGVSFPTSQIDHVAYFKYGYLLFITYEPVPEAHEIFKRFAKVFEQTYTRFLDLKQAEAQARESEIQLTLERVRARTMAMQHSDELLDAATLLFQQIDSLGASAWNCSFNIWSEDKKYATAWNGTKGGFGRPFNTPSSENVFLDFYKAAERGEELYVKEIGGEDLAAHYDYLATLPGIAITMAELKEAGISLPTFQVFNIAYFAQGYLMFITYEPVPQLWDVFKRFAKVFEQTYTRFLDLQKAEAQTREAQIEVAVERVRAKALAMHNSDEITGVARILRNELDHLNIEGLFAATIYLEQDDGTIRLWDITIADNLIENGTKSNWDLKVRLEELHPRLFIKRIWSSTEKYFVVEQNEQDFSILIEWVRQFKEDDAEEIEQLIKKNNVKHTWFAGVQLEHGRMSIELFVPPPNEADSILSKIGAAFDLAYKRFLDLQKAEAQTREARIEGALEKIRNRTLLMRNSNELNEAVTVFFQQFKALDLLPGEARTYFSHIDTATEVAEVWMTHADGTVMNQSHQTPLTRSPSMLEYYEAWKRREPILVRKYSGESLTAYLEFLSALPHTKEDIDYQQLFATPPEEIVMTDANFLQGNIGIMTFAPLTKEALEILVRFAKVFEFTYTRFLDLQKAEAQGREAQIQLALERVRARTMAMQKSEELKEVAAVLYTQLKVLGFNHGASAITIMDRVTGDMDWWMEGVDDGYSFPECYHVKYFDHPAHREQLAHWKNGEAYAVTLVSGEEKKSYDHYYFNETDFIRAPQASKEIMQQSESISFSMAYMSYGSLSWSPTVISDEYARILQRFANVFEQTYTRFLDLQKAEAQAREARIEAALEKIRSRSLAMHRSDELKEVMLVMFEKMTELDALLGTIAIQVFDDETKNCNFWVGNDLQNPSLVRLPFDQEFITEDTYLKDCWEAKNKGKNIINKVDTPEQISKYFDYVFAHNDETVIPPTAREFISQAKQHAYCLIIERNSSLFVDCWDGQLYSEEQISVLKRVAKVFEQAYVRFLDLQKAEVQVKEAQVEAALERVRSRSMAMHKSDELKEVVSVLYDQLQHLNFNYGACTITIMDAASGDMEWWMSGFGQQEYPQSYHVKYFDHPGYLAQLQAWKKGEKFATIEITGKQKKSFDKIIFNQTDFKLLPKEAIKIMSRLDTVTFSMAYMKYGALSWGPSLISEDYSKILQRFAKVFEQTYTRFLDLQNAEANAREAKIEASLERVRSKAMAMHSSQDLADTIGVFYHELELFSITPRRCGVGLLNKESRIVELSTMNTTEEGKSIEIVGKLKMEKHPVLEKVYENWLLNKEYHPVLRGNEIKEYYQLVRPQIAFPDYPEDTVQYGYFFFFPEGGVYAWTDKEMKEEELLIYRRFTSVLSLTYKRYKDLQQAEALAVKAEQDLILLKEEKKRTEDALTELQVTQKQLIQSEKMASLGELTAGIAHEIQNPLNFVNNFSEVSNELIDEMNEELDKGNISEAKSFAADIKQNLEKINHHGKRADAIVKGMLQHSRASSAQKELTDINALADEYIRLCYHGLRAKDKSFNASIKTDFDKSIQNIKLIPQDIGRVILNLLMNAFYAVSEQKKTAGQSEGEMYEPTVLISTRMIGDTIELRISDNGAGIPKHIVDKIFQPFFTTKPAGQGTGLGLSMSYDIITKGHGGELQVNTVEGKGTTFIILLKVQS